MKKDINTSNCHCDGAVKEAKALGKHRLFVAMRGNHEVDMRLSGIFQWLVFAME